jgi:hypothetical protein
MRQKISASDYKDKLSLYRKEIPRVKIEENVDGKYIVLKRTICEEFEIEDLDNL